ncbi:hypothetical protein BKA62DRAFT_675155 [Auriculariales sp. MPI-PUGE-AT-0066]|nr:hypothetical protein BKA62DRAFT_675155 [Auriculariales sp. MPI-PUGE-AT-0066]
MVAVSDLPTITSRHDVAAFPQFGQGIFRPICSPSNPDNWMKVTEYPSLDALCCTSCGARGDGPLEYHKSNAEKWGSTFVWLYCLRCMSAFGTIIGDMLRTYKSSPKDGSPTFRLRKSQRPAVGRSVPPLSYPDAVSSSGPTSKSDTATQEVCGSPPKTPSPLERNSAARRLSRGPFMNVTFGSSPDFSNFAPRTKLSPSQSACVDETQDKPNKAGKSSGPRTFELSVQTMDCEVFNLMITLEKNTISWADLPEVIRSHVQSGVIPRALEIIVNPGDIWKSFGFSDSRGVSARTETIFGRVVSGKPSPPHDIIVLASDSESEDPEPPTKRRKAAKPLTRGAAATAASKKKARKSDP